MVQSAYQETCSLEQYGLRAVKMLMDELHWDMEPIRDRERQLRYGDVLIRGNAVEIKTERTWTGNLFVEVWSNRSIGRRGWYHNLTHCRTIWFYFMDAKRLVMVDLQRLREYLRGQSYRFKLVPQRRYSQHNDTHGMLVPVQELIESGVVLATLDLEERGFALPG